MILFPLHKIGAPCKCATQGRSKYLHIWNLAPGTKVELQLNHENQPVRKEGRTFTRFLGTIARKPNLCPIRYNNRTHIPKRYKEKCWEIVEVFNNTCNNDYLY